MALLGVSAGAGIIPDSRLAIPAWSTAGVPGGIPYRTNIFTVVPAGGNIQSAINSCPNNQVVLLTNGTYTVGSTIQIPLFKGITVRGMGPTNTILISSGQAFHFAGNYVQNNASYPNSWGVGYTIVSGADVGSSNVTLSSVPASMTAGQLCRIDQNNDYSIVFDAQAFAPRGMGWQGLIMAVNGNVVTFWPPLPIAFSPAFDARLKMIGGVEGFGVFQPHDSGIENLCITNPAGTGGGGLPAIMLEECIRCWVSNVWTRNIANYHMQMMNSVFCEFVHCDVRGSPTYGPSHYGLGMEIGCTGCKFSDNIMDRIFPCMEINFGCSGNVIVGNFVGDSWQDGFGTGCCLDMNHGPMPMFNYYAHNYLRTYFQSDGYKGNSTFDTMFRNRVEGWSLVYTNNNAQCYKINRWARNESMVGNVSGHVGGTTSYEDTASGDTTPCVYRLGYPNIGNSGYDSTAPPSVWNNPGSGTGDNQFRDLLVPASAIIAGNWDVVTATNSGIVWGTNAVDNIPNDLAGYDKFVWVNPTNGAALANNQFSYTNFNAGFRFFYGFDMGTPASPNQPFALKNFINDLEAQTVTVTGP